MKSTPVKDISYYEAAIEYNEKLAEAAQKIADELNHPVIKGWCASVGHQHRRHMQIHKRALKQLQDAGVENSEKLAELRRRDADRVDASPEEAQAAAPVPHTPSENN